MRAFHFSCAFMTLCVCGLFRLPGERVLCYLISFHMFDVRRKSDWCAIQLARARQYFFRQHKPYVKVRNVTSENMKTCTQLQLTNETVKIFYWAVKFVLHLLHIELLNRLMSVETIFSRRFQMWNSSLSLRRNCAWRDSPMLLMERKCVQTVSEDHYQMFYFV